MTASLLLKDNTIMKVLILSTILFPLIAFCQLPDFYHSYDEAIDSLMELEALYPDIMDMSVIGYGQEDSTEIYAVKISDNVDIDEDEPRLVFIGQVHAEENIGLELVLDVVTDFMEYANYYPWVMYIATAEIYFIPSLNPEGLDVVTDGLDVTFRKNIRDTIGDGIFRYDPGVGYDSSGVDLNRNFSFNWVHGDTLFQGGHVELYDYYRGEAPFSESECQAMRDFAEEKRFSIGIVYHQSRTGNVSENVIYPWNWAANKNPPDFDVINSIGQELASYMHTLANPGVNYAAVAATGWYGNSHDWFYAAMGCYQYTIETSSIQPSSQTVLQDIIEDNEDGLLYLVKRAIGDGQTLNEVGQLTGNISDAVTGEPLEAVVTLLGRQSGMLAPRRSEPLYGRYRWYLNHGSYHLQIKKPGYATIDSVIYVSQNYPTEKDFTLVPLPLHAIDGSISDLQSGNPLTATLHFWGNVDTSMIAGNGFFSFELPASEYNLRIDADGYVSYFQSLNLNQGQTIDRQLSPGGVLFADDFESGAGNWVTGGDDVWEIDYAEYHSGGASFADSPNGYYSGNEESYAEFTVDLSVQLTAHLSFWHKYYFEPEYDYGYIDVSIDGGENWETLAAFNLQDIDWRREIFDLKDYCGEELIIRFLIMTDGSLNEPGWNIDDVYVEGSNIISDTSQNPSLPYSFYLRSPYPNPFNSSTVINYSISSPGWVKLSVYDLLGREAAILLWEEKEAGSGSVRWEAGDLASGVYFLRLAVGDKQEVVKALLIR